MSDPRANGWGWINGYGRGNGDPKPEVDLGYEATIVDLRARLTSAETLAGKVVEEVLKNVEYLRISHPTVRSAVAYNLAIDDALEVIAKAAAVRAT